MGKNLEKVPRNQEGDLHFGNIFVPQVGDGGEQSNVENEEEEPDEVDVESSNFDSNDENDDDNRSSNQPDAASDTSSVEPNLPGRKKEDGNKSDENKSDPELVESPISIVERISKLEESEIGQYTYPGDSFLDLTRKMKSCRVENIPYDVEKSSMKLEEIVNRDGFDDIFTTFRRIYEFIIHLHKLYKVKLTADNPDDDKEFLLLNLLETTFRKYKTNYTS